MDILFVKDVPALLVKEERLLVVGDLHIGRDVTLKRSGIHVANSTEKIVESLASLYKKYKANGIVLLGDVKESISYPGREEYYELQRFFYGVRDMNLIIAKGNHDARIEEILERLKVDAKVEKEVLLRKVALMHGQAMPSDEAMGKNYIVTGHSHPAVSINGRYEKAWAVATIGKGAKKAYEKYNKRIKLVIMPAFNDLITGSDITESVKFAPLLRNNIFDLETAKLYSLGIKEIIQG